MLGVPRSEHGGVLRTWRWGRGGSPGLERAPRCAGRPPRFPSVLSHGVFGCSRPPRQARCSALGTGRAVCPRCSAAWMERVRSPRLVRSLPQGLGLPGSGVTMVVSSRGSSSVLRVSTAAGRQNLWAVLSLTVWLTGSLCASQPLVGADLLSTAPSPAHTIPAPPCPAPLCRAAGLLSPGSQLQGCSSPEAPGLSLTWRVTAV